jgi:hypothetical protein
MPWHKVLPVALFALAIGGFVLAMDLARGTAAATEVGAAFVAGAIAEAAAMLCVFAIRSDGRS